MDLNTINRAKQSFPQKLI